MKIFRTLAALAALVSGLLAFAQQTGQPQLKIDSANRTLSVTADERVTADPGVAILHIGFQTQPNDAKTAYSEGARTSNAIIAAIKQAGIPETDIRSESQFLNPDPNKPHKYTLTQYWTVRVPPERVAEILDVAVNAGATSSGQIDWTVKDERALEEQALDRAAARSRENASVLAKAMGVRLGALIYVSNQISAPIFPRPFAMARTAEAAAAPLAIEPQKVSREASVYAVFAIE
jgi:uncharacterized protein YggE